MAEIVVTAQKRAERIQDVPISISALSGNDIARVSAKNLSELQGVVPGVYFSGDVSYNGSQINIRGASGSGSALSDEPVAVYVDGIFIGRGAGFGASNLLDIGSVQVIRGPQGTLQGRNATSGAVLFTSTDPSQTFGGYVKAFAADPGEYRFETAVTGPVTDTLSARFALQRVDELGWAKNIFDNSRTGSQRGQQARATLLWKDGPAKIRVIADYSSATSDQALARWAVTPRNPSPAGPLILVPTPTTPLPISEQKAIEDGKFALNRPNDTRSYGGGLTMDASYAFDDVELVSISGYRSSAIRGTQDGDGMAISPREAYNRGIEDFSQFSQEFRIQSVGKRRLSWILGLYYFQEIQDIDFYIYNAQLTVADRRYTRFLSHQKTSTPSAFLDATLALTDSLSIIGGVRYTTEKKDFRLRVQAFNIDTNAPLAAPIVVPGTSKRWDDVSYRAKINFKPSNDLLLYAGYSKGFKSGGFNAFGADPAFNPETLYSLEAGAKLALFDRTLTINASAYRNVYKDLQIRAGVPTGGVFITNAADSLIKGFEIETSWRPISALTFDANVAYTNGVFKNFTTARNALNQQVDATGAQLPRSPKWQYYLRGTYQQQLSVDWNASLQVDYRWRDTLYFLQTDQSAFPFQSRPLGELGSRLTIEQGSDGLSFGVYGNNLTDARKPSNLSLANGYPLVAFNKPRTIGIFAGYKF